MQADEDDYWVDGLYYRNPNNPAIFVEKRVGIGTTVNLGTRRGRAFQYGIFAFLGIFVLGIGLVVGVLDSSVPQLRLREDRTIAIRYPLYSYSFDGDQIQSIALVDSLPAGMRTNGVATDAIARGNYRLDGWGRSKLYVYKNRPPYIVIALDQLHIVYNEKEPEETKMLYARLNAWKSR